MFALNIDKVKDIFIHVSKTNTGISGLEKEKTNICPLVKINLPIL